MKGLFGLGGGFKWTGGDHTKLGTECRTPLQSIVTCDRRAWLCLPGLPPRELSVEEWSALLHNSVDRASRRHHLPMPDLRDEGVRNAILSAATVSCTRSYAGAKICPVCRERLGLQGSGVSSIDELAPKAAR